ncbi:skin secretory protein xP2-like [Physeter macrocephalus]|uniref:Skin secretory protein xP2-like n=1 Tax=Physeter macrocephalus TaxID=9755 RepID=A0A455BWM9_PHYMC|nr:skin secretory protein xP2-like [Physeter catodon]|eukprot:XP_028353167.1 skin secretory protein xP2-like [Physeter catodon]
MRGLSCVVPGGPRKATQDLGQGTGACRPPPLGLWVGRGLSLWRAESEPSGLRTGPRSAAPLLATPIKASPPAGHTQATPLHARQAFPARPVLTRESPPPAQSRRGGGRQAQSRSSAPAPAPQGPSEPDQRALVEVRKRLLGRLARQHVEAVRRLGEPRSWPVAALQSNPAGVEAGGPQAPAVGSAPGPCALRCPALGAQSPLHTRRPPDKLRMRGPSSQEGGGAAVLGSILFLESAPLQPRDPRKGPWHASPDQQRCPSWLTADALSPGSRHPACSVSPPPAHLPAAAEYRRRCPASPQENSPRRVPDTQSTRVFDAKPLPPPGGTHALIAAPGAPVGAPPPLQAGPPPPPPPPPAASCHAGGSSEVRAACPESESRLLSARLFQDVSTGPPRPEFTPVVAGLESAHPLPARLVGAALGSPAAPEPPTCGFWGLSGMRQPLEVTPGAASLPAPCLGGGGPVLGGHVQCPGCCADPAWLQGTPRA